MTAFTVNRRRALQLLGGTAVALALGVPGGAALAADAPADWGWTAPYDQVSAKSIAWLKDKGWWPLTVGFQPPWTGQNAINVVVDRLGLIAKRGVEQKFQGFTSGPELIEAFSAQRIQLGGSGNFPYHSLLDRKIPARGLFNYPLLTHAVIVPNDSPIKSLADLKGGKEPATIGIVTGSSAEFYFQAAAAVHGIDIGKDVILKNMPLSEQLQLPKGVAAVVPWDHTASLITDERKTGRAIDSSHPYNLYEGIGFVRQELIDNVPDVVQAITDAYVEAVLYIRRHPAQTVQFLHEDPNLKNVSEDFLASQVATNVALFKPTFIVPQPKFWAAESERIRTWLKERNRLTRDITTEEYAGSYSPEFARAAVRKLGWAIPSQPIYLPAGWTGKIGQLPYPEYFNQSSAKAPQVFPEPGDLTQPWSFAGKVYNP
jgi:sulfonate transport system substrate-binding protein